MSKNSNTRESNLASYDLLEDKSSADISMPYTSPSAHQTEVPAVKSMVLPANKNKPKTQLGLLSRLFFMLMDLSKPKKIVSTVAEPAKKVERYPTQPYSERRYGKTNRNNRTRPRRERGQPNHRYSASQATGYEQTQTKSSFTARRTQIKKKSPEKPIPSDESKLIKKPEFQSKPKKTISFAERQAIAASSRLASTQDDAQLQQKKSVPHLANTTASTASTPTAPSPGTQRRKNTRRYGGEPKLRHRSYVYEDHDTAKNK